MTRDGMRGTDGNDVLVGRGGNDRMEGGDRLAGGGDVNTLTGDQGNDLLNGGWGYDGDWLYGGDGNDTLDGQRGNDILAGGLGQDTFIFTTGADRILDFDTAEDRVNLESDLWDGNLIPGDVLFLHGTIIGGNTVLDFSHGDRLVFDSVTDWTALAAQIDYI
jgi:Ca2+-binding RTX toxin-like protein